MNFIKNIALSAFLTMGAFSMVLYTSCNPDECKDVVCANGGTCIGGDCSCTSGFEGPRCETNSASKIIGTYSVTETCQPPVTPQNWASTVTISSTDMTRVAITNFGNSNAVVTGHVNLNAITIDGTTINGMNVSGTGTINGDVVTINYTLSGGSTSYSCAMVMTRQ